MIIDQHEVNVLRQIQDVRVAVAEVLSHRGVLVAGVVVKGVLNVIAQQYVAQPLEEVHGSDRASENTRLNCEIRRVTDGIVQPVKDGRRHDCYHWNVQVAAPGEIAVCQEKLYMP